MKRDKLKVMLIFPSSLHCKLSRFIPYEPPLGLAYIAAMLEKNDWNVKILDCLASSFNLAKLAKSIRAYKPNVIGVSCLTANRFDAFTTVTLAKEASPDSVICMGGPHVSLAAEDTLKHIQAIDMVIRGEGEFTMTDLVQTIEKGESLSKVLGISWRDSENNIIRNPSRPPIENLDKLPFPARHLLPLNRYALHYMCYMPDNVQGKIFSLMASRGCLYNCSFCQTPSLWGRRIRYRSVQNVISEIEHCMNTFGYKAFRFHDDTLTTDRKWIIRFCDELTRKGIDAPWNLSGRVNLVDEQILEEMKKAGCYSIAFGIESGDPYILKNINKGTTVKQVEDAVKLTKKAGILPFGYLMTGNPGENEETLLKTLELANRLKFIANGVSCAVIYPSTQFFKLAQQKGNIQNNFSWADKIDEIPPELIDLPISIDPFVPTFSPPEEIRKIIVKHKEDIKRLVRRGEIIKLIHDYGPTYLLNWRFWYNSLRYLPTRKFLHRMYCVTFHRLVE